MFWIHLNQKNRGERNKRLKFYGAGIELLRSTRQERPNPKSRLPLTSVFQALHLAEMYFIFRLKKILERNEKI